MNLTYTQLPSAPKRYLTFADFLAHYFPHKVQKITINAGFTCPNRDGTKGNGGCTYCNNQSFNPDYSDNDRPVGEQLERGKRFFRNAQEKRASKKRRDVSPDDKAMKFLAYFQAYTNTYGELEHIKRLYEEALSTDEVVGLVIGTRPDCVSDDLLDYFADLHRQSFVLVEYGVESTYEHSLQRIRRGHSFACSVDAIQRTHQRDIPVGAHTILGLPGETHNMLLTQIDAFNALPLDTLKLHQLQIIRGTIMAYEYLKAQRRERIETDFKSDFSFFDPQEYASLVVDILERLRPDIVVERFASSSPPELLLAPNWGMKNHEFVALVDKEFSRRNTWQGRLYTP